MDLEWQHVPDRVEIGATVEATLHVDGATDDNPDEIAVSLVLDANKADRENYGNYPRTMDRETYSIDGATTVESSREIDVELEVPNGPCSYRGSYVALDWMAVATTPDGDVRTTAGLEIVPAAVDDYQYGDDNHTRSEPLPGTPVDGDPQVRELDDGTEAWFVTFPEGGVAR